MKALMVCILIAYQVLTSQQNEDNGNEMANESPILMRREFQMYFKEKRRQQISAVKALMARDKYEAKYDMVSAVFGKLFDVQLNHKQVVENSHYIPGDALPDNHTLVESLSIILENCALFGDIVLKLPDISHRILKANSNWTHLYEWCLTFSMASDLVDETTAKMLNLAAQELQLIARDESYVNPYKKSNIKSDKSSDSQFSKSEPKKKPKAKKGPRLSRASEL